jgi:dTDP-4-dehydrorhamnose 3,5-epimerase
VRLTFSDDRGFFHELFRRQELEEAVGALIDFVQANHSHSIKNTLRGIHIAPWYKLVTVIHGQVQAVVVDTRLGSETFGKHISVELSATEPQSLLVPPGCGNSFLVLSDTADYLYLVSDYWAPGKEQSVRYDDPDLAIVWQSASPLLSTKDMNNPTLREVFREHKF